MKTLKKLALGAIAFIAISACNSKPKPVSKDITKTTVSVNGQKDSVINNPEKNYGNATVSEPCVKCLITVIQATDNYKMLTTSIPPQNMIYKVNWITSKTPADIGSNGKIVNGMAINVNLKDGGAPKKLTTFLYDNENARLYVSDKQNNYHLSPKMDSTSLKKIRNSCFWGVASAK